MKQIRKAKVQNNDLKGTAALDFHGGLDEDLIGYANEHGIETTRYSPIGVRFYIGLGKFSLEFVCIDNQSRDSFKSLNDGRNPVVIFHKEETLESFLNRVKRFEVVLSSTGYDFAPHDVIREYDADGNEVELVELP